jgi:hypothetical protein
MMVRAASTFVTNNQTMKKLIAYLILIVMFFSACQKKRSETDSGMQPGNGPASAPTAAQPTAPTVSLTGKIMPVDAVTDIYLLGYNPAVSIPASLDPVTGTFKATGLTDGAIYAVHFVWGPSYRGVLDTLVKLTPGQSMDIGTMKFASTGIFNVFSYQANGSSKRTLLGSATYSDSKLTISAKANFPTGGDLVYDVYKFTINLDNITGPGTYICKGTATSGVTYETSVSNTFQMTNNWNSLNAGGDATVQITAIDPVAKIISGTFAGTLVPASAKTTANMSISNGVFKITYQ